MRKTMNLDVLSHIVDNDPERIEDLAQEAKQDPKAAIGIAAKVLGEKTDSDLSEKQKFVFDRCIRPLIEAVPCDGVFGMDEEGHDTCPHGGIIDDESLLLCYQEDEFMCQNCRYDSERIAGE
jgi:hypothetical protein